MCFAVYYLINDISLSPSGSLPKGGHGGKDHNIRTQVNFIVLKESVNHNEHKNLFVSHTEHIERTICFTCWLRM